MPSIGAGQPGEKSGLDQALHVQHQIEGKPAQFAADAPHFTQCLPALHIDAMHHNTGWKRVGNETVAAVQQPVKFFDLGVQQQVVHGRQGMDDVAEGGEFDDEKLHAIDSMQAVASSSGATLAMQGCPATVHSR